MFVAVADWATSAPACRADVATPFGGAAADAADAHDVANSVITTASVGMATCTIHRRKPCPIGVAEVAPVGIRGPPPGGTPAVSSPRAGDALVFRGCAAGLHAADISRRPSGPCLECMARRAVVRHGHEGGVSRTSIAWAHARQHLAVAIVMTIASDTADGRSSRRSQLSRIATAARTVISTTVTISAASRTRHIHDGAARSVRVDRRIGDWFQA